MVDSLASWSGSGCDAAGVSECGMAAVDCSPAAAAAAAELESDRGGSSSGCVTGCEVATLAAAGGTLPWSGGC